MGKRINWIIEKLSINTMLKPFVKYILTVNDEILKTEEQQPCTTVTETTVHQLIGINLLCKNSFYEKLKENCV